MGENKLLNTVEVRDFYSGIKPTHPNNIPTALSVFTINYSYILYKFHRSHNEKVF